ncbi:MAG: GNAT family N-acetyltransferase [Acidobacteriota bacterium]
MSATDDPKLVLTTERLLVRGDRAGDLEPVLELWTDPEVTRHLGGPRDPEKLRSAVEENIRRERPDPWELWNLELRRDGSFVGNCGLLQKEIDGRDEVEIVYVLARRFQGRGLGLEAARAVAELAFEERGLERLVALIEPENMASVRLALRLGLRRDKDLVRQGRRLTLFALEAVDR